MAEHKLFKITLRVGAQEKAMLNKLAHEEGRSINGLIKRLVLNARLTPDVVAAIERAVWSALGKEVEEDHARES